MSNIRTIADIQQEEYSVQSIALRETAGDISTQTTILVPRSVLNDDLRAIARERLNNGELRLPIRTNANGTPVGDVEDIRNLNENLDGETIRSILEMIAEDRFNSDVFRNIISNISAETLNRTRDILSRPTYNLQDLAPILNIIIYANVGFYDFNASTLHLSTLLSELNLSQDLYENNLEEVGNIIDENTNDANNNSEERNEEYNRERSNVLNSLNWRTILRRGGTLLFMGVATYLGTPYIGPLGNLGMRILENSPNLSSDISNGTDSAPRTQNSRTTWNDVSGSFWNSWALLARYMGRRSD
jgi:DNA-binding TFAR19-related protein (PDSD5 family)